MKNTKYPVCPQCGNEANFQIEKSPYGSTTCLNCRYSHSHEFFSLEHEGQTIIKIMRFKESGKYYDEFDLPVSSLDSEVDSWYYVVEEVRNFRLKSDMSELEWLIGYSDESVKNYKKNDIYPVILKD